MVQTSLEIGFVNGAHQRLHIRVPQDRLSALRIGEKVHVCLARPAVGYENYSLRHGRRHSDFHPDFPAVRFHKSAGFLAALVTELAEMHDTRAISMPREAAEGYC
jgi:hypothetical protein